MDEVIALENQIRAAIELLKTKPVISDMRSWRDGRDILLGKKTYITGTRLERLRAIAAALLQETKSSN